MACYIFYVSIRIVLFIQALRHNHDLSSKDGSEFVLRSLVTWLFAQSHFMVYGFLAVLFYSDDVIFYEIHFDSWVFKAGIVFCIGFAYQVAYPSVDIIISISLIYVHSTPLWLRFLRFELERFVGGKLFAR